jgi:hypothetical protein
VVLVVLPERKGLLDTLLQRQSEDITAQVLGPGGARVVEWAARLGGHGPLARLPFDLQIR